MRIRLVVAASFLIAVIVGPGVASAVDGSHLRLQADQPLPAGFGQGIARVRDGWIVAGTNALGRLDDRLRPLLTVTPAIPVAWAARGYDHIGDVDVAGRYLYVPFEQPDHSIGRQATARYDARTLRFVDAVELPQHENSFVTVDPRAEIAYSMDQADGGALLRYDLRRGWRPLPPLPLGQTVRRVQGGDVASGSVWLSTDDSAHTLFRVDARTGTVEDLGSAGHTGGEAEGIDATPVGGARLHVMVVDPRHTPVWLTGFAVVGATSAPASQVASTPSTSTEGTSGWPPILVLGAVVVAVAGVGASSVFVYRARVGLRVGRRRDRP